MDATMIFVIVIAVAFCIGGPIIGSYASKASHKAEIEEMNRNKTNKQ